jgi:hypothetical protein
MLRAPVMEDALSRITEFFYLPQLFLLLKLSLNTTHVPCLKARKYEKSLYFTPESNEKFWISCNQIQVILTNSWMYVC